MTINEEQDEIISEFSDFDDWMDRYQMLIDMGNEQKALEEKYKTEDNLIDGCQSRVWLQCDPKDGKLIFTAESDALIVKGIITLLIRVLSGHTPDEILDADLYREDRIERASIANEKQRTLGNGKADADVCTCLQSQRHLKPVPHIIREEYKLASKQLIFLLIFIHLRITTFYNLFLSNIRSA